MNVKKLLEKGDWFSIENYLKCNSNEKFIVNIELINCLNTFEKCRWVKNCISDFEHDLPELNKYILERAFDIAKDSPQNFVCYKWLYANISNGKMLNEIFAQARNSASNLSDLLWLHDKCKKGSTFAVYIENDIIDSVKYFDECKMMFGRFPLYSKVDEAIVKQAELSANSILDYVWLYNNTNYYQSSQKFALKNIDKHLKNFSLCKSFVEGKYPSDIIDIALKNARKCATTVEDYIWVLKYSLSESDQSIAANLIKKITNLIDSLHGCIIILDKEVVSRALNASVYRKAIKLALSYEDCLAILNLHIFTSDTEKAWRKALRLANTYEKCLYIYEHVPAKDVKELAFEKASKYLWK